MRNGDEIPQPPPAFTANGGLNHQHQHQQHQSAAWTDESEDSDSQSQFAPHYVPGDAGASDDELDGRVPVQHRDNASHATFVWDAEARGADSLHPPWMDRADKPAFTLETKLKQPLSDFGLLPVSKTPLLPASVSLSRSSPSAEVPLKDPSDVFSHANQSFPSTTGGHSPTKITHIVRNALLYFDALECKEIPEDWRLEVSCLCVAEQIDFSIQLSRLDSDGEFVSNRNRFEVSFHRTFGDEARYLELTECIRSRCRAIDDDPLVFLPETLDPWMDARQEITGRRAAIGAKDALELLKQLHADLHVMTLHEIAKEIKDHCRHQGNRKTFYRVDPAGFLSGLREMLSSSSLEMSRFGVFILLQFSKDHDMNDRDDRFSPFFRTPYDKSSFAMLLHDVAAMHQDTPCGEFTCEMVTKVQKSWIFAPIALLSQLRNSPPPPQMPGAYRFRRSMTTFRPVTATTALETLAAARVLIPGDEEILFAFVDENGQELVFTTESVITFYRTPPPTATKRTDFSLTCCLSFLDASDATASDSGDGEKEDAVVFVMGPAGEEIDFTIAIAQDNDEPDEKKKNQFAKTVFNAIFLLQNTAKLRDERKRSVEVVKKMLAEAQAISRSPVSATTEMTNDSTTWFGGGGMGYGYFSS